MTKNIKLELFPSRDIYYYEKKKEALTAIKDNGLNRYSYELIDLEKHTIYMSGLWITKLEYRLLEDGYKIKDIKIDRKLNKILKDYNEKLEVLKSK